MNRLEELIAELCPDGVEYKTLGETCSNIISGKNKFRECNGLYPVYGSTGIIGYSATYCHEGQKLLVARVGANCGLVNLVDGKYDVSDNTLILSVNPAYDIRFAYHQLKCLNLNSLSVGAGQPLITATKLKNLRIPLPPLEVQREIVRILDAYSERVAELTDRLAAELDARKKQYEYYSATILNFEDDVEYKSLIDVADIYDSLHQTPCYSETGFSMIRVQDINGGYINPDNTLKVSTEDYLKFTHKYQPRTNDIVVSRVGSYGRFSIIPSDFCCLGQNVALIHPKINPKYLYYILNSAKTQSWIANRVKGSNQKSLSLADIKRLPIPIISRVEQERIVAILDRFDKLCNDITSGLPAEIEARRKQYEHYRDRLLTFKEKTA